MISERAHAAALGNVFENHRCAVHKASRRDRPVQRIAHGSIGAPCRGPTSSGFLLRGFLLRGSRRLQSHASHHEQRQPSAKREPLPHCHSPLRSRTLTSSIQFVEPIDNDELRSGLFFAPGPAQSQAKLIVRVCAFRSSLQRSTQRIDRLVEFSLANQNAAEVQDGLEILGIEFPGPPQCRCCRLKPPLFGEQVP